MQSKENTKDTLKYITYDFIVRFLNLITYFFILQIEC